MGEIATGITISFGTSSYTAKVTGIVKDGLEVPIVDVSHMESTGYREIITGKLKTLPQLTVSILWDSDEEPPVDGVQDTITVTFPTKPGNVSGAVYTGTGYVVSDSADWPLEEAMTGEFVWQFDGATGPTLTPGSAT